VREDCLEPMCGGRVTSPNDSLRQNIDLSKCLVDVDKIFSCLSGLVFFIFFYCISFEILFFLIVLRFLINRL